MNFSSQLCNLLWKMQLQSSFVRNWMYLQVLFELLGIDQLVVVLLIAEVISVVLIGNQAVVVLCRPVYLVNQ